jgi:cobalt-zinc-cadmium efflux system membrane fusion protein
MNDTINQGVVFGLAISLLFTVQFSVGCHSDGKSMNQSNSSVYSKASISENGEVIFFPPQSIGLQQIKTTVVHKGTVTIPVIAPARVVASISASQHEGNDKFILFESQDITSLYSQYRQTETNLDRAQKNFNRTKEMYDNHGATSKDINDAETEMETARETFAEAQGKLRADGFDPGELEATPVGTAWLISDVPESELNEVQQGEEVDIFFSAFPEKKFTGHAIAVGDVVDPITRMVKVRVTVPNPNRRFLPGMFARVDFGDPKDGIILLPASAVVNVEEKNYVFLATGQGTFRRREVILENANNDQLIVQHGLQDGEEVVIAGAMLLKGLSFGY